MAVFKVKYQTRLPDDAAAIVAPAGMATPYGSCINVVVEGGQSTDIHEKSTGQHALQIHPETDEISIVYSFDDALRAPYPNMMFAPRANRFTQFAAALIEEAEEAAGDLVGLARAQAVACATAQRFTYGHPETKFNDGLEEVPALGCGLVEGSCVDINTYFIAALRAAGIEAGYVTGYFFPAEKGDHCTDGHCWVVTRSDGQTYEWDIAHHLKCATKDIKPALNPKPGFRAACFHSMGLDFPDLELWGHKALIEPVVMTPQGVLGFEAPHIQLSHPALSPVTAPV